MNDTERIVYQLIKSSKNKGIWIKDIKAKSGLHTQLVNTNVKNLEKKMLIKSVKSVKVTFASARLAHVQDTNEKSIHVV